MNTIVPKNIERYRSHYKESNLWSKIKRVAQSKLHEWFGDVGEVELDI